jgi:hypothetical protein
MKKVYSLKTKLPSREQERFFHTDKLLEDIIPKIGGELFYESHQGGEFIYLLPYNCFGVKTFGQSILIIGSSLEENIEKCVGLFKNELAREPEYYEHHQIKYAGPNYDENSRRVRDEKGKLL